MSFGHDPWTDDDLGRAVPKIKADVEALKRTLEEIDADRLKALAEKRALQERLEKVEGDILDYRSALSDAAEDLEELVGYVPDYFREKWGYDECAARIRRLLDDSPPPKGPRSAWWQDRRAPVPATDRGCRVPTSSRAATVPEKRGPPPPKGLRSALAATTRRSSKLWARRCFGRTASTPTATRQRVTASASPSLRHRTN